MTFNPSASTASTAIVTIVTSDPVTPIQQFQLSATGSAVAPPTCAVSWAAGSPPQIPPTQHVYAGDPIALQFTTTSSGDMQSLSWYATKNGVAFSGSQASPNVITATNGADINQIVAFTFGASSVASGDVYQIYVNAVNTSGLYANSGTTSSTWSSTPAETFTVTAPTGTLQVQAQTVPNSSGSGWFTASPVNTQVYTVQKPR